MISSERCARLPVLTVVLALAVHLAGCFGAAPTSAGDPVDSVRVSTTDRGLLLDGQPWWPTGFNAYQLATDWAVNLGCGAMVDLDDYFGHLPPNSLTRFDAFQALAIDRNTGTINFTAIDAVFDAAKRHGQLLIPVLTAQDGACEDETFKERDWYVDGWQEVAASRAVLSFQDWIRSAVTRWHDDAALAAWELVGEPETSICGTTCTWPDRSCPPNAAQVLRSFTDISGALVRTIDPTTPITAGLTGGGQCGTQGDEYGSLAQSPWIDILQYHDYGADGVALPGDQWNGLARRLAQADQADKPLLMGEIGQTAGSCGTVDDRAATVALKVDGQRTAGIAGFLLWAFVPDPRPTECTYDIGYDDPLWSLLTSSR